MKSRVLLAAVVLLTAGCGVFANQIQFGFSGTTPVPRDYDGDGITDLGLYYEPLGMWYIFGSRVGYMEQQWGFAGAKPVPFDWNNDAKAELAVYAPDWPGGGTWFFYNCNGMSNVPNNVVAANATNALIGRGAENEIQSKAVHSAIVAGYGNIVHSNAYAAFIGAGAGCEANGDYAVVGGGFKNRAKGNCAVVAGGGGWFLADMPNVATADFATVSGGFGNTVGKMCGVIPGGWLNEVHGDYGIAMGLAAKAQHANTFVFNDSITPYSSTKANQFVVNAGNGIFSAQNAGTNKAVKAGEYYRDNSIVAWGKVGSDGARSRDFGVVSITHPNTGEYLITIRFGGEVPADVICTASAEIDSRPTNLSQCRFVAVDQDDGNKFRVYINNGSGEPVNNEFTFIVTGRER